MATAPRYHGPTGISWRTLTMGWRSWPPGYPEPPPRFEAEDRIDRGRALAVFLEAGGNAMDLGGSALAEVGDGTGSVSSDRSWRAVRARDPRFDGRFVFAVRSTGIYCRPSCPARRPRRGNVLFFPAPGLA